MPVKTFDISARKTIPYSDSTIGEVMMSRDNKGNWHEKRENGESRVNIKADDGKIVVESKGRKNAEEDLSVARILQLTPKINNDSRDRLHSFRIVDSKADIDVGVVVAEENKAIQGFREGIKNGEEKALYKSCMMEKMKNVGEVYFFEKPGERRIQIGIDKENNEVWVIDSHLSGSVEKRVDTEIFRMENGLISFDPANARAEPGKLIVEREEENAGKFLSNPDVLLRKKAIRQEFQKRAAA